MVIKTNQKKINAKNIKKQNQKKVHKKKQKTNNKNEKIYSPNHKNISMK